MLIWDWDGNIYLYYIYIYTLSFVDKQTAISHILQNGENYPIILKITYGETWERDWSWKQKKKAKKIVKKRKKWDFYSVKKICLFEE